MNNLQAELRKIASRIDDMTQRERGMLLAIVALLIIASWYYGVLIPHEKFMTNTSKELAQTRENVVKMRGQEQELALRQVVDPNEEIRKKADRLKKQLLAMEDRLREAAKPLVDAREMTNFLRKVLARQKNVTLISLDSQTPRIMSGDAIEEKSSPAAEGQPGQEDDKKNRGKKKKRIAKDEPVAYLHGMDLRIEGEYFGIMRFLQELEEAPWMVFWENLTLSAQNPPLVRTRLNLYTLSLDETLMDR